MRDEQTVEAIVNYPNHFPRNADEVTIVVVLNEELGRSLIQRFSMEDLLSLLQNEGFRTEGPIDGDRQRFVSFHCTFPCCSMADVLRSATTLRKLMDDLGIEARLARGNPRSSTAH